MAIPVDSNQFVTLATGNCSPVTLWQPNAQGVNVRTEQQAVNAEGLPLWNVEILRSKESFGVSKTVPTDVLLPSRTRPNLPIYAPVKFENLMLDFYISNKSIREIWTADGVLNAAPAAPQRKEG